ncbi:hypothetical protein ACA30_14650 [Virgibacillus soli]|uniref:Transposase InsH N-terminal domain-containing protein n=1 Tax=Lederbergia galactosidilytica TaxID=217031 RepID=A0A177ZSG8_9BACI|nr:hypothetical protein ACA30_14650 [Virgibacillus soli]OAK70724.1 hypothetical protein ABB05_12150 [Lederbergia galactosidilytica]
MMTKNQNNRREQLEMLTIEQLVPQDHLVRKLDAAIDFSFIYPLVEDLYSTIGRPSIDPVVLIKMTFIQYTFGIRSMRQTIKEIETNMAYRRFLERFISLYWGILIKATWLYSELLTTSVASRRSTVDVRQFQRFFRYLGYFTHRRTTWFSYI